jgi:hypothetical protein
MPFQHDLLGVVCSLPSNLWLEPSTPFQMLSNMQDPTKTTMLQILINPHSLCHTTFWEEKT